MSEAEHLYAAMDRLVFDLLSRPNTPEPDHRHSPIGSALHLLHALSNLKGEHCVCANDYRDPPL